MVRNYRTFLSVVLRITESKCSVLRCTRSGDTIARVEQMVMEDRRLTVKQIAANAGISVGSVDTILHDDLKRRNHAQSCLQIG